MAKQIDFWTLLKLTQEYVSQHYAAVLTDKSKLGQLKAYVDKYLRDNDYHVENLTTKELIDKLYCEMAEYSVLTPFLSSPELEAINVNGWDDIALTYLDGSIVKLKDHFHSPQHAVDIIKRLLHHSGMIIDNATPTAQGHLPGNTRITALKDPIVDEDRGVSVSIRLLHPSRVTRENLVETGFATQEMVDFLCMCIRYGVPFVVAGATSSCKTTLLNAIMTSIPDTKRVFTIESGSRELSLVRRDQNGQVTNNVVHTLSRPSDNPAYDITQEGLIYAKRTLTLPQPVMDMLTEWRGRVDMYRTMFRESYNREYYDYICVDQLGNLLQPSYVTNHFAMLLRKHGFRQIRFHDLRHTFASILINKNKPLIEVSNFLGHSDISTTANIYAHLDKASKQGCADTITEIFDRKEKKGT